MSPFLLLIVGIIFLIKSSDILVDGASSLALRLRVKPLVIGMTVVAFGTSLPELVVSIVGASQGATYLVMANILGSNIVNILLIPGIMAVIAPFRLKKTLIWRELPMSFLAAVVLVIMALQYVFSYQTDLNTVLGSTEVIGEVGISHALLLLCFFSIFLYYIFGTSNDVEHPRIEIEHMSLLRSVSSILGGLAGLIIASQLTVESAITIADTFGLGRTFVGMTLVALGTSSPELITGIVASLKKKPDIGIGNLIGSNIFNIFLILGITPLLRPLPITGQNINEIIFLMCSTAVTFLLLFVLKRHSLGRIEGSAMILLYCVFLLYLVMR